MIVIIDEEELIVLVMLILIEMFEEELMFPDDAKLLISNALDDKLEFEQVKDVDT